MLQRFAILAFTPHARALRVFALAISMLRVTSHRNTINVRDGRRRSRRRGHRRIHCNTQNRNGFIALRRLRPLPKHATMPSLITRTLLRACVRVHNKTRRSKYDDGDDDDDGVARSKILLSSNRVLRRVCDSLPLARSPVRRPLVSDDSECGGDGSAFVVHARARARNSRFVGPVAVGQTRAAVPRY